MQEHLTAGIDAGTSSIKVAIVKSRAGRDGAILATSVQRIRRRNLFEVAKAAYEEACQHAGIGDVREFQYVASTGDADAVDFATGHFYGMTTHARGALFLVPEARAVLDMGALHARAIKMDERGKVLGHRMTSQCASGSGQFLENIARYLGVPLEDVGRMSLESGHAEEVSSICAVLAETDVINMVSRGLSAGDVLKGIHLSIAGRLVKLLRSATAEGTVALTGGLANDLGMVAAIRDLAGKEPRGKKVAGPAPEVKAHPHSILAGAVGAALLGAYRFEQLREKGRLVGTTAATTPS
ncbi:MAG: benzoyl-CoA reductase subunit D [Polyangiaceae bacterium]|nr:benzoyl-CoA reductase subunit D [Polyangiaceae bacterium]